MHQTLVATAGGLQFCNAASAEHPKYRVDIKYRKKAEFSSNRPDAASWMSVVRSLPEDPDL
jgi:hypothetical protein